MTAPVHLTEETAMLWDGQILRPFQILRYRDFGLIRNEQGAFTVAHLPSGAWFAGRFRTINLAAEFAVEADKLRNHWGDTDKEAHARVNDAVVALIKRLGELVPADMGFVDDPRFAGTINGYEEGT